MPNKQTYQLSCHTHRSFKEEKKLAKLLKLSLPFLPLMRAPLIVELHLCSSQKIKALNARYRHKNKVTDVLSFPVHENLRHHKRSSLLPSPLLLGEIYIALPVARRQAKEQKVTLERELFHLFIHGLLHLWGYDHELSKKEEKIMFSLEEKIVKKVLKQSAKK